MRDTARSTLDPARLFDLLADPIERQKWDLCPPHIRQEPIEAASGPALQGARYTVRGTARGIDFVANALITAADRPGRYQTRTETTFERAYPDSMTIGTGAPLLGLLSSLLEPLLVPGAAKKNFRDTLRNAEKHAQVRA